MANATDNDNAPFGYTQTSRVQAPCATATQKMGKKHLLTKDDSLRSPAMCVDRAFQCQLFLKEQQAGCTKKKYAFVALVP